MLSQNSMTTVIIIDVVATAVFIAGCFAAFRQDIVMRWFGRRQPPFAPQTASSDDEDDPLRYALRIAGVMIMAFSAAIALLFTIFAQSNGNGS